MPSLPKTVAAALLLVFLAAHLAFLPPTLEDVDSINFALGVRQFDVARHQPHPPGYPIFIALAKASTAAFHAAGSAAPASRGLAFWSAVGGTAGLAAMFAFFLALEGRRRVAWWATVIAGAAPVFWFTALRPLSDTIGLACAMTAIALIARADAVASPLGIHERHEATRGTWLIAGAFVAGLAIGVRSQTFLITLPVLAVAFLRPRERFTPRDRALAILALTGGVLVWAIPLILFSGGLSGYLHALRSQGAEDFSGVEMLWTRRSARVAAHAVLNSFVWPWGWVLGLVVSTLASWGFVRLAWRSPRAAALLIVAFGPYAAFHLLFQETDTVRYALPLIPAIAYLTGVALDVRKAAWLPIGAAAIAAASLFIALPASRTYAAQGAPVFRAFDAMKRDATSARPQLVAMHAGGRRATEWVASDLPAPVAKAPHGREWLTLITEWRAVPAARVWFLADPKRTDLAMFDPRSRLLRQEYRWGFVEPPFVGGVRPAEADWYAMQPPGWMLETGWSVTAEVAGVTAQQHLGPHVAPAIAWLRSRRDAMAPSACDGRSRRASSSNSSSCRPARWTRRRRTSPSRCARRIRRARRCRSNNSICSHPACRCSAMRTAGRSRNTTRRPAARGAG
ncbi:MAG: hypothetical protein DMF86_22485 [Acidobacteria bacterium]|nr:MAG: hypothetical protein DMF86_22485 [Acidobacteriota bacterium]